MKLLFVTRRVDRQDARAGFVIRWIEEFARSVTELYVVCLEKGDITDMPPNVRIFSLGKEQGKSRVKEFFRFHALAARLVPRVDGVFTHQNPEYGILIAPWARLYRKRLIAWYVHGAVTRKLRLLLFLVDAIVTASRESCRIKSPKVHILSHGIDTDYFRPAPLLKDIVDQKQILTVGRISPSKNIDAMIRVLARLVERGADVCFKIIGAPAVPRDLQYKELLERMLAENHLSARIIFMGPVPYHAIVPLYQETDLFINFSDTGSIDKAVLEAMSCGVPVLTSNEAFREALGPIRPDLYSREMNMDTLVARAEKLLERTVKEEVGKKLRNYVVTRHDLKALIRNIVRLYEPSTRNERI